MGSKIRQDADDFIKYIVSPCPAFAEFDYAPPIRADQLNEPGRITSQVIKLLFAADLVIADLTGNNPNVYYELSLRHALGKPVIHMAFDGTGLSFDIRDNRTIFYTMHSRAAEAARDELANQIRHVHQSGYKSMNPILETVGIINLERSADPDQNALGKLIGMVESLEADMKATQTVVRRILVEQRERDLNTLVLGPGALSSATLGATGLSAGTVIGSTGAGAGIGGLGAVSALGPGPVGSGALGSGPLGAGPLGGPRVGPSGMPSSGIPGPKPNKGSGPKT